MTRPSLALWALPLCANAASADVIASNPDSVLKALRAEGLAATMETDDLGDPKIVTHLTGKSNTEFSVLFYGCTDNTDCSSIQFYVAYDTPDPVTALKMNQWNREWLFTKATLDDEGDPGLEMDVILAEQGVDDKLFATTIDLWRQSIDAFEDFIGW
ncbi:YbjN domain-containing protein [Rhodovulum sp. BSW8]|uniref:YbjN domain-containing protein n=1 Tax=Rhodovulum sp. BSW8 TaxID=2259645 RepID=UPI000DE2DA72|nr:YbjN domain-containing protein [Rhodovulum sp. BSW8]RBO52350.1 YbjN domain-containing protein [Rhodovulum sp. BSW8]